jgi:hypothetical protein
MRKYLFAICAAALFAIPTAAFSESIQVALGGARVGFSHHRDHNKYEGLYDRYESQRCRELRPACMPKKELGEQVTGNCRRFRELCD